MIVLTIILWAILTSVSPCPLALNAATISLLKVKRMGNGEIWLSAIAYAIGRATMYAALGAIAIWMSSVVPDLGVAFGVLANKVFGPALIFAGLLILYNLRHKNENKDKTNGATAQSVFGFFVLGVVFAFLFGPVSAVIFFVKVIPLVSGHPGSLMMLFVYGLLTAAPVFIFALAAYLGVDFEGVCQKQMYFRKVPVAVSWICVIAGIYYTVKSLC
jgi:hypothetical protein